MTTNQYEKKNRGNEVAELRTLKCMKLTNHGEDLLINRTNNVIKPLY